MRGFGGDRRGFRLGERDLRPLEDGGERTAIGGLQCCQLTLNGRDLGRNLRDALILLACGILEKIALGREVCERAGIDPDTLLVLPFLC